LKSAVWLRRIALAIVILGIVHILVAWPLWRLQWSALPLERALSSLYMYLGTGLWILASGFVLGFLAEAGKVGETWAEPFARGTANFLLVGGVLAGALMWSNPGAWALLVLSAAARACAGKKETAKQD
jgi:hypothetical protein